MGMPVNAGHPGLFSHGNDVVTNFLRLGYSAAILMKFEVWNGEWLLSMEDNVNSS